MLMREAIERFMKDLDEHEYSQKTIDGYRSSLVHFNDYLEEKFNIMVYVEDMSAEVIRDFLREKREEGCTPNTRNRYLFIFRSFCGYLTDEEVIEENPVEDLKPAKTRKKERVYLTREQVLELAEEIDHGIISRAVLVAYHTGLRPSELLGLKLDDVDLERGLIYVRAGKGNKDRRVPISEKLEGIIRDYLDEVRPDVETDNFFATESSGGLSLQYFNRRIKKVARSLGWENADEVSAHVLRHSCASRLVSKDVNVEKIRRLLGHSSIDVTSVYCHSRTEDLSKAVNSL